MMDDLTIMDSQTASETQHPSPSLLEKSSKLCDDSGLKKTEVDQHVSSPSILASIVCIVAGTGILGIPHALSRSGWVGLLFLFLSALMAQYCGCLLIQCLYHGQSARLSGFTAIGTAAFGRTGWLIAGLLSQMLLICTPTLYMILAGENLSKLFFALDIHLSRTAATWIVTAVLALPFVLIRNIKDASLMSIFAAMTSVCLLLALTVASVSDAHQQSIVAHHDWAIPENIPIAFSTFSFAYCGNVIFPHLEASMVHKARWPKVLLVSTVAVTAMYIIMGLVCYMVYGSTVQSPAYDSMAPGAGQNVAMILMTIHVLLAIPMYLFVFSNSVESWVGVANSQRTPLHGAESSSRGSHLRRHLMAYPALSRTVLRLAELCFCALFAMLVPYFADLMTLIGTIAGEALTFVLPCVFWIKLSWGESRTAELLLCAIIAILGTFCAVFGTAEAVRALLKDIHHT